MDSDFSDYLADEAPKYVNQLPTITISKGQASVSASQPYFIKDPEKGDTVMIIDTTGQTKSLDNTKAVALLTRNQLILKNNLQGTRTLELSELGDLTIDKDLAYDWLETISEWLVFFLYPFAVLFSFAFRSAQVAIYGLVGMPFSRAMKTNLDYQTLMRLSAISLTPVIIFDTLILFFRLPVPLPWFINALIAAGYLIYAIRANSSGSAV